MTLTGTLSTNASAFAIQLNAGGTITNAVTFNNTGALTIGAAGFTFTGGATDTVGAKSFAGTIASTNTPLNFRGSGGGEPDGEHHVQRGNGAGDPGGNIGAVQPCDPGSGGRRSLR